MHVSDCYAPRTGGIETQVQALAVRQAASGDDVRVVTATPGHGLVWSGDDVSNGIPVHRVVARMPFELPVHPHTAREVGRLLDGHPVDVVHVHAGVVSPFAWGAMRAAARRDVPILVTVHSVWGPVASPGFALSDALGRWTRWGATMSAVSSLAADRIAASVPRAGRVLVVPNGIDPALWQVQRQVAPDDVIRIASVLRMAPRKRTLPLVRILQAAARALGPQIALRATLVGDGPERSGAERYVRAHGLADVVRFAGRLDRAGILEVYACTDLYVQPSVKESFGIAALEARTAGLPVIARSQTGTTEFVHDGVEGLLADDDAGMVAAIVRAARDRSLLAGIARHNSTTPPQQAWPAVLQTVAAAYTEAIERAHAR
jgi:glycosyltransferase involved in cell wall biosynthesis